MEQAWVQQRRGQLPYLQSMVVKPDLRQEAKVEPGEVGEKMQVVRLEPADSVVAVWSLAQRMQRNCLVEIAIWSSHRR